MSNLRKLTALAILLGSAPMALAQDVIRVTRILETPRVATEEKEADDGPSVVPSGGAESTPLFFLRDRSKVAGHPALDALLVDTRYGRLRIPSEELVRVRFVRRIDPEIKRRGLEVVANLGADDFDVRENAMDAARALGADILPLLRKALESDNEETQNRAQILVEELEAAAEEADASIGTEEETAGVGGLRGDDDEIITSRMSIRGQVVLEEVVIQSRYGDLKVDVADLGMIQFQTAGPSSRTIDVEPRFQPPSQWLDSKMTIARGQDVRIEASGTISVSNYGVSASPAGATQYSTSGTFGSFPMLALVGKIGKKGKPFLVGAEYKTKSPTSGRLYLSIVPFQYNPLGAVGKFSAKVRVTGVGE